MIGLLTALTAAAASPQASAPPPAEVAVFRCLSNASRITVLRDGGTLIYRVLRRGVLELQLSGGAFARTAYSGGGEIQAYFRNGDWTYVAYDRVVRTRFDGLNEPDFQTGVDVLRRGRVAARIRCSADDDGFVERQMDGLPQGTFVPH